MISESKTVLATITFCSPIPADHKHFDFSMDAQSKAITLHDISAPLLSHLEPMPRTASNL